MTRDEAVALAESEWWTKVPLEDAARFQFNEEKLCMPFSLFHEGMEKLLGRPIFTHEFAHIDMMRAELKGDRPAPTLAQIMDLIPAEKRIVVAV